MYQIGGARTHLPVDCQESKCPASEKSLILGRLKKKHCSLQDEDSHESQFHVDQKSLLGCHRDVEDEDECVSGRGIVSPSCRSIKSICLFFKALKLLIAPLSDLLLWRDRFVSTSVIAIFMIQSFACLLRLFQVTALNESFHDFSFRLLSCLVAM